MNKVSKIRLDQKLVQLGYVSTRSQAENYIKLGFVLVDNQPILKPGYFPSNNSEIKLNKLEKYVSRAGLKLEAANTILNINFKNRVVLDVGSSTGGFTDYALRQGAKKVIAVDVGTNQLHPDLINNNKIEIHEKTDIRDFKPEITPDIIMVDVSFISIRLILPHIAHISDRKTQIIALLKPQFEAGSDQINRGIIKNDRIRRKVIKDFEVWTKNLFIIKAKTDSDIAGSKGNLERFYLLCILN